MTLPVTDSFTGTSGTEIDAYSTNWTRISDATRTAQIQLNGLVAKASYPSIYRWNADAFDDNQYSKITLVALSPNSNVGIAARCSASAFTAYFMCADNAGVYKAKCITGTVTSLANYGAPATNDVIELRANGSTIGGYKNGSLLGDSTDSAIASGSAGIETEYYSGVTTRGDDWKGGNLFSPNVTDAITVSESKTVEVGTSQVDKSEAVTVGEIVTAELGAVGAYEISKSEAVGVSDAPTVQPLSIGASAAEAVTVGESVTAQVSTAEISKTETITVTDAPTASVQDATAREVSKSEAVGVADAPIVTPLIVNASATQAITVTDTPTLEAGSRVISVTDGVTLGETITATTGTLVISVSESITVTDAPTVSVIEAGAYAISVSEGIGVTEGIGAEIASLALAMTEAVTVTDAATVSTGEAVQDLAIAITPDSVFAVGVRIYP